MNRRTFLRGLGAIVVGVGIVAPNVVGTGTETPCDARYAELDREFAKDYFVSDGGLYDLGERSRIMEHSKMRGG